jgi:hypothetical protein
MEDNDERLPLHRIATGYILSSFALSLMFLIPRLVSNLYPPAGHGDPELMLQWVSGAVVLAALAAVGPLPFAARWLRDPTETIRTWGVVGAFAGVCLGVVVGIGIWIFAFWSDSTIGVVLPILLASCGFAGFFTYLLSLGAGLITRQLHRRAIENR